MEGEIVYGDAYVHTTTRTEHDRGRGIAGAHRANECDTVAADVPDAAASLDTSNAKANRDVLEGLDATRYAQLPPPTTQPGILGVYYLFYQLNPTAVTFASPTPPPFSGTQNDTSYTRVNDRG